MSLIPIPKNIDFFEDDWFLPQPKRDAALNLYETKDSVVAEVGVMGVDPKNIEISVRDGYLEVKGTTEEEKEEDKKNYWKKEIYKSSFERLVKLPINVDVDKVEATQKNGILKIKMPKKLGEEPKKIQIKSQ